MVKRTWLLLTLLLNGCVTCYNLNLPPPSINLEVGNFSNLTYESGIAGILREKIFEEASSWGIRAGKGEKVLTGEILEIDYEPLLYDEDKKIVELKAKIRVRARILEKGEIVWEKEFEEEGISFLKGSWKESRRGLLERLCERVARRILYTYDKFQHTE